MPFGQHLRGDYSEQEQRQYEAIKQSELRRGASEEEAKRIAAATVNKRRSGKFRR